MANRNTRRKRKEFSKELAAQRAGNPDFRFRTAPAARKHINRQDMTKSPGFRRELGEVSVKAHI